MHLCNRLKVEMCIYRRGTDHGLFAFYFGLYESVYQLDKGCVPECVEAACRRYPYQQGGDIDHAIFLSNWKRSAWNSFVNAQRAVGRTDAIRVKCEKDRDGTPMDIRGSSANQSDMILWPGVELIGCTRGSSSQIQVVNGVIYSVESVTATHVTLCMHEDYSRITKLNTKGNRDAMHPFLGEVTRHLAQPRTPLALSQMASTELLNMMKVRLPHTNVTVRWHVFARLFPSELEVWGNTLRLREDDSEDDDHLERVTLTHLDACRNLRMTYALCYYSAQGTTLRDRHVVLFDTRHQIKDVSHFAMRHLIVGLSRATHGSYVHIPTTNQEATLLKGMRGVTFRSVQ